MLSPNSRFATEFVFALGDDERVRVLVNYDLEGYLGLVRVFEEKRMTPRRTQDTAHGAERMIDDTDLFSFRGNWQGDAVIRFLQPVGLAVTKQNLRFKFDGTRFYRSLAITTGDQDYDFEKRGIIVDERRRSRCNLDLVIFEDSSALVHVPAVNLYIHGPLHIIAENNPFHVEAGIFLDEDPTTPNNQFPISFREGIEEASSDALQRYLARSVRLYAPNGRLSSVTNSYHRYSK